MDTSMLMISKRKSPTCNACPTICATGFITGPLSKVWKNGFASDWRKSSVYARSPRHRNRPVPRKNPDPATVHLIGAEVSRSKRAESMASGSIATGSDAVAVRALQGAWVEDLHRLQKAAQNISSILDLDPLIDTIVNEVARSFGCVEANVYLHDEEHGELVLAGVHGCSLHGKGQRLKIGKEGMVGYVASTGQMRYAPDVRMDQYYIRCEDSTLSEVAIPLHSGDGGLVGVFTVSHPELNAFPAERLRLLQAFCNQVSAAVHNARRFQRERDERETMNREAEEARAIQQALLPK